MALYLTLWKFPLLVFVILAFTLLAHSSDEEIPGDRIQREPLKIGVILPLSGDASFWGSNPRKGIELALKDLEKKHPAKPAFKVIFDDDQCDPAKAVTAFKRLVEVEKVQIVLGPSCSSASLAVAPLALRKDILLFVFSEADSLSGMGKNIFRLWLPNGRQAKKLAQYIRNVEGINTIALLSIQNAYGEDFSAAFKEEFTSLDGKIVLHETYPTELPDPRTLLLRTRQKKPQAIVLASYIADGISLCHKMISPIRLFSSSTLASPDFLSKTKDCADGMVLFEVVDGTQKKFKQRWVDTFHEPWPGLQSGGSLFYDLLFFLDKAASEVGSTPSALEKYFSSGKEFQGKSRIIRFDTSGDLIGEHVGFRVDKGALVPLQ